MVDKSLIIGEFEPGKKVLLIDDLITQAYTKLEAFAAVEANDLLATDLLLGMDREQGGVEILSSQGKNEMVAKLFWLQFVLFVRYFVKLAQNDFRRSRATAKIILLTFLIWTKSPKFRLKIVLQPSQCLRRIQT